MTPLSKRFTAYGSAVLLVVASLTAATAAAATAATAPAATSTKELCGPGSVLRFNRSAFPAEPNIDNQWLRLWPGMQYTTTGKVISPDGTTTRARTGTFTTCWFSARRSSSSESGITSQNVSVKSKGV